MGARIIIVGSGFAGVTLAEYLTRHVARDVEVVVITARLWLIDNSLGCRIPLLDRSAILSC